jgi:uncharacterized protein involved in exopolysaccharide biosynthesis
MNMELFDLLKVVRRWLWLIIAIVVVTEVAVWFGTQSAESVYTATARLQISTPQREEVAAYDQYRFNPRDEIAVAINNFVELLQSDEVYKRTTSQLGLNENDAVYTISAVRASDADFVNVTVEAPTPELAAEIANTHINVAIAYYGELRSQSTRAEQDLFAEQLRVAEQELAAAEKALTDFRTENGIYSLESQMATQQRLLEQLQLERDQRLLIQAIATATPASTTTLAATTAIPVVDPVAEVDKLIAQRMKELEQYAALAPQYHILTQNVEQTRALYQDLMDKYNQAELTATAVQAVNFIQVIRPAYAQAESSWLKLAVLALAGSLGLGVMLAFLLQYISGPESAKVAVPVTDHKARSHRHRKTVSQGHAPKAQESHHKLPSLRHGAQGLWKRVTNLFHPKAPKFQHTGAEASTALDAGQESIAVQGQPGSTETNVA